MNDEQIDGVLSGAPDMPAGLAETIRAQIERDTRPVKPMMNPPIYALIFLGIFGVVSVVYAAVLSFKGWHALGADAAMKLLVAFAVLALAGSSTVASSMRPAAGRLYSWWLGGLALLVYEALIFSLFADYSTVSFLHQGMVCLGLGVLGGVLVAGPIWLVVRRGLVVQPVLCGAGIGLVGGLAGLTALTLHCALLTVPHTGVWHAGIVVVCVGLGAVAGRAR